ncbi:MAG: hypothetical protein MUC51_00945 [Anaerolineae bacterium]|nr:hypothetical protein [Anaerolineae bacterium]
MLFPRWAQFLHVGLGSPLFTFHPPLAYALLDLLSRIGIPHPIGWQLLIAGGLLAAFAGAYLLVFGLTGRRWPAVLAATAYLYAPYVLRNALERGSVEVFSMFLYPWVFWGLLRLGRKPGFGRFIAAMLLWAACIGFHVLGPLMLAPFAGLFALGLAWRYRTFLPLLALIAGAFLTAPIWAPIFAEQSYVHVQRDFGQGQANAVANSIPLDRLLALPAIYDAARDNNEMGDRLGLLQGGMLLSGFVGAIYAWRKRRMHLALAISATTLAGLGLAWMLTASSDPVWRALAGGLERLQYRSRLLGLQALFAAVTGGLCLALLPGKWQRGVGLSVACLAVLVATPSLYVDLQHRFADFGATVSLAQVRAAELRSGGTAFTLFGEFTPRWRTEPFDAKLLRELGSDLDPARLPLVNPPDGVKLLASDVGNGVWDLELAASAPTTLTLRLFYYPRWQVTVDGRPALLGHEDGTGYAQVRVGDGTHRVVLRYGRSVAESIGIMLAALTALALVGAAVIAIWRRRTAPATAPNHDETTFDPPPPIWLMAGLTAMLMLKFTYIDPATTWLRCASTADRVCGAQGTANVRFPDAPALRGYTVPASQAQPGDELRVDLYWGGEAKTKTNLSSFVHIRNSRPNGPMNPRSGNEIWAQEEHQTPGGLLTSEYLPGKLYKDEFRVPLPEDLPPGEYFVEVGWFDPESGEQLDPQPDTVQPPLRILWRSILLPSVQVR